MLIEIMKMRPQLIEVMYLNLKLRKIKMKISFFKFRAHHAFLFKLVT